MNKPTILQRLQAALIQPQHFMLVSKHGKPTRHLNVRPLSVILICLALLAAGALLGTLLGQNGGAQSLLPQHMQLQRQYDQLQTNLAETTALNELKEQEFENLKKELAVQQAKNSELSKRLRRLESILEARKSAGVHLLSAQAKWRSKSSLQYDLTLVKGGSYPRQLSGYLLLTATSPDDETVTLEAGNQSPKLPYRIETHSFLRGVVAWEYNWHPDKLLATVFDPRGKELLQMEISIKGKPL